MTKQQLLNSLEIKVGDEAKFSTLYTLIGYEMAQFFECMEGSFGVMKNSLPYDLAAAERRGFENCLRRSGYSVKQLFTITEKIRSHVKSQEK